MIQFIALGTNIHKFLVLLHTQAKTFKKYKSWLCIHLMWINLQVLMSLPCVLVTPKRKLAGRLAVMKKVLHFFGEFLVEGTGGSSVFKNIQSSGSFDSNKTDNVALQKQKYIRWPVNFDLSSEGETSNNINAILGNLLQKQSESIKRHRRWEIRKVKISGIV